MCQYIPVNILTKLHDHFGTNFVSSSFCIFLITVFGLKITIIFYNLKFKNSSVIVNELNLVNYITIQTIRAHTVV